MFSTSGIQHQAQVAGPTNFGGVIYAFTESGGGTPGSASAGVYFFSDGSVYAIVDQSAIYDSVSGDTWYAPVTTNIGTSYWIRATLTSGTAPSGNSFNTWHSLATTANWTLSVSDPFYAKSSCVLLIEISSDSGGSTIVANGVINMTAETYFAGGGGNIP